MGEEVFRMFCMRVARDAYPADPNGVRFVGPCEGTSEDPELESDEKATKLVALLQRRDQIVPALDQVFGDETVDKSQTFAEDELQEFLWKLLPFYEEEGDTILPRSTRALGKVMQRLTDENNEDATKVRETIARISKRVGYRSPDRVLAMVRPALTYERVDELIEALLALVAPGADGHDTFVAVLEAAALELAQPAEPKDAKSTLSLALELVLQDDQIYADAEAPRTLEPLLVLKRDENGDAIAEGDPVDSPFPVAGRNDSGDRNGVTALALSSAGSGDGYQTFDAHRTAMASLLRDSIPLIRRGGQDRSTIEKLLRVARPLLGADKSRSEAFGGAKTFSFTGPDVENGPMSKFLWSISSLLKLPETKPLLEAIERLVETNEPAATELINAALAIDAKSDEPGFDGGKLNGGQPHEFWDDLIEFGQRIVKDRPGLMLEILKATEDERTRATGIVLAHHMQNKDVPKLKSDTDINSEAVTNCTKPEGATNTPAFCVPVDRTMSGGDVGMNRSLFQRTLSLVHGTYKAPNCNKEGATLTVQVPVPTTFPNPPLGPLAPFIGIIGGGSGVCPTSAVAPPPATSYKKCQVIEQKSGAVTLMRTMLKKGKIVIKDPEITDCARAVGEDVSHAQERESGITDFTSSPTPKALARFVYGTRNKFLTDLFEPLPTIEGVDVVKYEPNQMYALEIVDPDAVANGEAQSFLTASVPLLSAFDAADKIDDNGDPVGSYMFAELLELVHMHYGSPQTELCPDKTVEQGREGCIQSVDPTKPFFANGTNVVSYEPLVIWSLLDQDLLGVLQRSLLALKAIRVPGKDGAEVDGEQALSDFFEAVLKSNPDFKYKDGRDYAKTNLCEGPDAEDKTVCACPNGAEVVDAKWCKLADGSFRARGRIIANGVPPLYLMLDALNDLDTMWKGQAERHGTYLDVRSTLVDQFLATEKDAEGKTRFKNRRVYAFARRLLPWLRQRLIDHEADRVEWANGLVDRLAGVLAHPITARALDLFDHFWADQAAGDEVAKLLEYMVDEQNHPEVFTGVVLALADTLTFVDKDPDLTPAIRFAALLLAENALDSVNGEGDPDIKEGTAYRFLEVAREVANLYKDDPELSTLTKMLRNAVLPMSGSLEGKSPAEVFIDAVADVNRNDPEQPTEQPLDAADNLTVFAEILEFLSDEDLGLERLYKVIENRDL